jgi:plastocyanin
MLIRPMERLSSRLARTVCLLVVCAVPALLAGTASAHDTAELRGTLVLVREGRAVAEGVDKAVVYFTPVKKPKTTAAGDAVAEMATARKQFVPRRLVVPVGSRVRFPNQDPILHNAFSVSGGNAFDVGLYGKGPGKEVVFNEPGLVRIFCNVHQAMAGYVLVIDTPFSTAPDPRGAFALGGLPDGAGTLTVWHEQADPLTQEVTLPLKTPLRLSLAVSKPRVPRHLNKFGKAYSTGDAY